LILFRRIVSLNPELYFKWFGEAILYRGLMKKINLNEDCFFDVENLNSKAAKETRVMVRLREELCLINLA
jgi:hypothetical protein